LFNGFLNLVVRLCSFYQHWLTLFFSLSRIILILLIDKIILGATTKRRAGKRRAGNRRSMKKSVGEGVQKKSTLLKYYIIIYYYLYEYLFVRVCLFVTIFHLIKRCTFLRLRSIVRIRLFLDAFLLYCLILLLMHTELCLFFVLS
jgi:hypothetical protein